jgi:hypothetical protein
MAQPYDYTLNIPSPLDAFSKAFNVGAAGQKAKYAREDREAAIARKEAETLDVNNFFNKPLAERTSDDYLRLGMINPELAEMAQKQWDSKSEAEQGVAFRDATQIHAALTNLLSGETAPEIVDQIFASRVEATRGDPVLNRMWVDARELAKTNPEGAEAIVGSRIAVLPGGKDYFATMKTRGEESRAAAMQAATLKGQQSPNRIALRKLGIVGDPLKPTDADKFSNGLTMYRTDLGEQYGVDVNNNILQGEDYSRKLAEARDFEAATVGQTASERTRGRLNVEAELAPDIANMVAQATKSGEIGQQMAADAYNTLGKVRLNIGNLEAAIAAVDAGADTGFVESQFPDWRASSIELRNIQRQLGLDVIGSVTFGALSEGELKLALETALPLNLQPAELKDWLQRKREAQLAMASELEKATMFFSGGGTLGEYVRLQQRRQVPSGAQNPMGNRAAVLSEMDAILGN